MIHDEELRLSQIASERATNPQVRTLAQQLVTHARSANDELNQIAQRKGVTIPTGKDAADDENKWREKKADKFDEDYVERIVKLNKDAVDLLEDQSRKTTGDPELSAFASKHLASMQSHLNTAKTLEKAVD
jgi:putative membrane protein